MKTIYRCGACGEIFDPGDVETIERDQYGDEWLEVRPCPTCGGGLKKTDRFGYPRMTEPLTLKAWE